MRQKSIAREKSIDKTETPKKPKIPQVKSLALKKNATVGGVVGNRGMIRAITLRRKEKSVLAH